MRNCGKISVDGVLPCRFGGASALEEDRAARKLEVDEHGIARRMSDDIWSNATSRQPPLPQHREKVLDNHTNCTATCRNMKCYSMPV